MSADTPEFSSEDVDRIIKDTMPVGYIFWDPEGNGIDCSPSIVQLFGLYTPQEVFENWERLSPPYQPSGHSSEKFVKEIFTLTKTYGKIIFEWQHQTIDGERFPVEVIALRHNLNGREFLISYFHDLRGLRKAQYDLDTMHPRLASILRSCPICFGILLDDRFSFVTPFMSNFLGVNVGDTFSSLLANPETITEGFDSEIVSWVPVTIRTRYGATHEMLAYILCFEEENGSIEKIVWLIDVTQSRRLANELTVAKELAETATKAKSAFLASMSHEIRTPMNAIIGLTHLALLTPLTPQQTEYIESVQQSAHILLRLINDILDFSKIEADKMVMEYREFSLGSVLSDIAATVSVPVRNKKLEFHVEVDEKLPLTVMGDSVRLHQVILNLLSNAIKFTEKGDVRLNVEVVEMDILSLVIRVSVTDSGIGMTPLQIQGLFQPFAQATAATTRQFGGTGLGLAISKKLVEAMYGEISCQSEQGKGTTFTFTARFGVPLEGEVTTVDETTEIRADALLVGDNTPEQTTMQHYIELLRAKVYRTGTEATAFKEILELGKIAEVDFIVFDCSDLRKDFVPLYSMLCEAHLTPMPVCVVTEHPDLEAVLGELGIKDSVHILEKPVIAGDLFNVVSMTADRKKALLREKRASESRILSSGGLDVDIPSSVRGAKILLAEDNKINQLVATELLRVEGFVPTVAENGRIALELLQEQQFDLILMDVQMPEMDGFEATRTIRADARFDNVPILAMTANAMSGDRKLSLEAGMNDHITKPIEPKEFYRTLVKWLRK